MIRPAFTEIGIFLIPFAVYALFLIATRSGLVLSFILLAHFSGAPPNSTYIPAHIENGKFVPGVEK